MSEPARPEPRMSVSVSDDRSRATLTLLPASGLDGSIDLSLDQLSNLIEHLGAARSRMVAEQPAPSINGATISPIFATQWAVQPEALTEGSVIAFQHPAYGPVGFVLQPADAQRVVHALSTHLAMLHTAEISSSKPS